MTTAGELDRVSLSSNANCFFPLPLPFLFTFGIGLTVPVRLPLRRLPAAAAVVAVVVIDGLLEVSVATLTARDGLGETGMDADGKMSIVIGGGR